MFEQFTDHVRGVVVNAQEAARDLGNDYIGTEHLLLAMLRPDSGMAYTILNGAGLTADRVRSDLQQVLGRTSPLGEADAAALESIGIDLDAVRAKVEEAFGPGALNPPAPPPKRGLFARAPGGRHLPFSVRAKKVLELSLRESLRLKDQRTGTEHVLLGLIREGEGLAAKVIHDAGIDLNDVRKLTLTLIAARKAA